jgi:hypothetical protein
MTAPNLKSPTTITGKTARVGIASTALVGILTNSSGSNKVLKINSILSANTSSTGPKNISVSINDGSNDVYIVKDIIVPLQATQIVLSKETYFYLEEGDSIKASSSSANDLSIVVGYEEIS